MVGTSRNGKPQIFYSIEVGRGAWMGKPRRSPSERLAVVGQAVGKWLKVQSLPFAVGSLGEPPNSGDCV